MRAGDILIWGEFPPNTHTGVSISNQTVLHYLHLEYIFPEVIEEYSWNKKNFNKVFHYLHLYFRLFRIVCGKKIRIFYFTLPMSVFGGLKFLAVLPVVKILSPKTILIAHIHRGDFKEFIDRNRLNRFILKCSFRFIDEIIVLSLEFVQDVLNFSIGAKVGVLHNTSLVEPSQKKTYRNYSKEFICISNYIKSKGIQELVDCFMSDALKDYRLTVYGHIYDKSLYRQLKSSVQGNILLNGTLDRGNITKVLEESDCMVIPSWNEGQPIVVIEAMSLGIPVIAAKVGDIPGMLGEEYQFLTQPQNTESMLQSILAFDRFEEKKKISEYLYQRYLDKYSNESYKKKLLEIFV